MTLAVAGALLSAAPAFAAGSLEVIGPKSISMSAFTDSPDSFVGSVTLHATGGDVAFTFVPGDLAGPNSSTLDRSHLTLLGGTTVIAGSYEVVTIKVSGVIDPGRYAGSVTFAAAGQALDVPLALDVKERPALAATTGGQLKLDVTRCGSGFSCWVAGWLMPDGGKDGSTNVLVTNSGKGDAEISAAQVFANGGVGGHTLSDTLPWTGAVTAGATKALPLVIKRDELPPDHYTGNAYVTVKDGTSLLTIPVGARHALHHPQAAGVSGRAFRPSSRGQPAYLGLDGPNRDPVPRYRRSPESRRESAENRLGYRRR